MSNQVVGKKLIVIQGVVGLAACAVTILAALQVPPLLRKKQTLAKEAAALEEQIKVLREEKANLSSAVSKGTPAPLEALVKPRAAVKEFSPAEASRYPQGFRQYSLWLDVPEQLKGQITKVTYFMNHPSFNPPVLQGDPDKNFYADYAGYGCLANVIITLTLNDGTSKRLDFDQCGAL